MPSGEFLQEYWYGGRPPPVWARLLADLYAFGIHTRRGWYRRGWMRTTRLPVPVIVVGNITVGGTGKTPLTIALVDALMARGRKPGVLSRGYAGSASVPTLLDANPDPAIVGDEPALIRRRTGAPVAIGAKRPDAARLLVEQGVEVIVADDGLQHYALARDVEICVLDGARRFGNGRLLPAGPLREPERRLHEVDFIVCNGGEPRPGETSMRLALMGAVSLREPSRHRSLTFFASQRVHAVAGIGNPGRFFDALRGYGIDPVEHPLPDHHRYTGRELAFGDGAPVLMTEKDAVKCLPFAKPDWWSVPVTAVLPAAFVGSLIARLGIGDASRAAVTPGASGM